MHLDMNKIFGNMVNMVNNRNVWVAEHLSSIPNGESILDAGAGPQGYRSKCTHLKYVSQDFCEFDGKAVAGLDKNSTFDTSNIDIVSDIINIPVEDESFDNILCTEVLEHIKHPELAIKEFARIIRGGGMLILTAPFASYTHMAPYHYVSGFDKYWYMEILPQYGFEIVEIIPNGNYFDMIAEDLRRIPIMCEHYAKPLGVLKKIRIAFTIRLLNKISAISSGSDEFGTNEYMVVARKVQE
jgi:ubiquinone/menaquinone biosynthesis C-methylase UbiE